MYIRGHASLDHEVGRSRDAAIAIAAVLACQVQQGVPGEQPFVLPGLGDMPLRAPGLADCSTYAPLREAVLVTDVLHGHSAEGAGLEISLSDFIQD